MWKRFARELLVVFADDLRQSLTSPLLLLLTICYFLYSAVVALPYVALSNFIMEKFFAEKGAEAVAQINSVKVTGMVQAFTQLTGDSAEGMAMASVPFSVHYIFFLTGLIVPVLAIFFGAGVVADDLGTGHIRYLSLRGSRSSLLFGRMISRGVLLAVFSFLGVMASFAIFFWQLTDLSPDALGHFLRSGLLLAGMSMAYLALAALCSTLVRSTFLALVLGIFFMLLLGILGLVSDTVGVVSPSHYWGLLFSPNRWPLGLLAYAIAAAVFTTGAWFRLRTRDL